MDESVVSSCTARGGRGFLPAKAGTPNQGLRTMWIAVLLGVPASDGEVRNWRRALWVAASLAGVEAFCQLKLELQTRDSERCGAEVLFGVPASAGEMSEWRRAL